MSDTVDQEFEKFLNDQSEINALYAQSKAQLQPSQAIADKIHKAAHGDDLALTDRPAKSPYFLPISLAATLLIAVSLFWIYSPQPVQPLPQVSSAEPGLSGPTHQQAPAGLEKKEGPASPAEPIVVAVAPKPAPAKVPPQLTDTRPSASEQGKPSAEAGAAALHTLKSEANASEPLAEAVVDSTELLSADEPSAEEPSAEEPSAEAQGEDVDLSIDWVQQLAGSAKPEQFRTRTSQKLSAKAWLEKILQLHKNNKKTEVIENIKQFKKVYPKHKLPKMISEHYQTNQ